MIDSSQPTASPAQPATSTQRLMSLDALRGFDMFWIIGADSLVYALHRMSQTRPTKFLANQLEHADWAGFHFCDLIFPLFVFVVGVALVFSLGRTIEQQGRAEALKRVFRRGILLFVIGIFYSGGFTIAWPDMRLMGVLNRIALAYFFAGLLFCFLRPRGLVVACAGLLAGYWALMTFVPFPDVRPTPQTEIIAKEKGFDSVAKINLAGTNLIRGTFAKGVNLANYIDQRYLPGRKYDGTWDPEGILSTLPAIATCLLGVFAGLLIKNQNVAAMRKVAYLLGFGAAGVVLGFLWGLQFPVIKKVWTSSYVLVAGGYSAILLGLFYLVVDMWKWRKWCQPFVWMGMNSITVYLASNIIGGFRKVATRLVGGDIKTFFDVQLPALSRQHLSLELPNGTGDMVISVVGLLLAFWFVYFLYRKKIFLRL